jgi:rod shape-determining protein MreB and related proteins
LFLFAIDAIITGAMLQYLDKLSTTIAVDLGTDSVRVWEKGKGLIGEYPSYLAIDSRSKRILASGQDAYEMRGRVAANVSLLRPFQKGQIWDKKIALAFLKVVLRDVLKKSFFSPTILFSIPASLSQSIEQETIQLGYDLGAKEILTVVQPLAAAIGAGMPVADSSGGFIMQLGAGINEVGVVSLGTLVKGERSFEAGDDFEQGLQTFLQKDRQILISRDTARMLIHKLVSVGDIHPGTVLVTGKDEKTTAPKELQVSAKQLLPFVEERTQTLVKLVKKLLSKIPAELTVDVVDKGLLLSGGGALLSGLDSYLVPKLGIPISVVDDPERAVIRGMGTILDHLDEFRRSLGYRGEESNN